MALSKTTHRRRRERYRDLIHTLNQRYRQEFERAERLRAELADIHGSRAWRLFAWLRRMRRWFAPERPTVLSQRQQVDILPEPPGCPANSDGLENRPTGVVSIIIPFRDRPELLRACLAGIRHSTYRRLELILVDNGSTQEATRKYLERLSCRRRVQVVTSPGPFNFSRLCNEGARRAAGDHLLFLNNDTEVLDPDWLEQLLAIERYPEIGVMGATLLYPDHTIQHAGIIQDEVGNWAHIHRGMPADHEGEDGALRRLRSVPAVTGACLLIPRRYFVELGGFDERFAGDMGDVDLCCRVCDRGLLVAITPHARLIHFESLSRGYARSD